MPASHKEIHMLRTADQFLTNVLFAILAPLFIVMATAFVAIPQSLGVHPGEVRAMSEVVAEYHPT